MTLPFFPGTQLQESVLLPPLRPAVPAHLYRLPSIALICPKSSAPPAGPSSPLETGAGWLHPFQGCPATRSILPRGTRRVLYHHAGPSSPSGWARQPRGSIRATTQGCSSKQGELRLGSRRPASPGPACSAGAGRSWGGADAAKGHECYGLDTFNEWQSAKPSVVLGSLCSLKTQQQKRSGRTF